MTYPPVVVVDENDKVVGEAMLADARERGLIYRIVFVIVHNPDGRILLQKRSPQMQVYPDCWDISASGHVDDGHSYLEAAYLELEEETGVKDAVLTEVAHFFTDERLWGGIASKRFVKIYKMDLNTLPENFGVEEVTSVRWFTPSEMQKLVREEPESVAEGLRFSLPYILGEV